MPLHSGGTNTPMENYPLTPEERAEIERLELRCSECEAEILHLEHENKKLEAKIAEYQAILYGPNKVPEDLR